MYGLRAKARNFSREDMEAGVKFAHENGVKVYVTANIVAHNEDLEGIREYFRELKEIGPDALIISDPGVFMIAREECPDIERHISTQANSTNYATYNFWYAQGASRVVAARELSLAELSEIRANIPEDAFSVIILLEEMQTWELVHILAAGNTMSWRKAVRANIFQ